MASEPLTARNICGFPRGYGAVCEQTATHGDRCAEHHDIRCRSCGDPATTACDYCGQFVCGAPLCPLCEGHETAGAPGAWGFMNHSHRRKEVQQIAPKPAPAEPEATHERPLTAQRLLEVLRDLYRDEPPERAISIGRWHGGEADPVTVADLPHFIGDVRLTVGELREMPDTADDGADQAVDFVLTTLAEALGVKSWTPCDGTETWEGDVAGTVYEILRTARVLNDENEVARHA